jgi:hypothetical protein
LNHLFPLFFETRLFSQQAYVELGFQFEKYRYRRKNRNALFFFVKAQIFYNEVYHNISKKLALKMLF